MRAVDGGKRDWLRIQVTDLSLTAIEEASRVRFAITSLATARPVANARIRLDALKDEKFVTLVTGTTDADGAFTWTLNERAEAEIKRIVVTSGLDTLVLEPGNGPAQYAKENWTKPDEPWLGWTVDPSEEREEVASTLCHVFTERPIYRREDAVHIKGYVRSRLGGALSYAKGEGTIVVKGPGDQEWRIPTTLDETGNFYHRFDAATPATGDYT